jgi:hypothetical protein
VTSFRQEDNIFIMKKTMSRIDSFMNNTDYFLLGDVARILRCQPYKIVYLLTTSQVPEPALRIGNKRIFTIADVQRLSEKLQVQNLNLDKEDHDR